jgi:hypothetical protein
MQLFIIGCHFNKLISTAIQVISIINLALSFAVEMN